MSAAATGDRAVLATMREFALRYAGRGIPVLACAPRGKRPLTRHGVLDATTDVRIIQQWWHRVPEANVGIATGSESRLFVLDEDPRHGGDASLVRLQREHHELPSTATVHTGGGGEHRYYGLPPGRSVRSRANVAGYSGVDVKCDGGFVVAPPSIHPSGGRYRWHLRAPIAGAPDWLLDLAAAEPERPAFDLPRATRTSADLTDVLRDCPRVRARFERDATGLRDASPSGVDLGLASGLALLGCDADAIAQAVIESRTRAGLPNKGRSYLAATVRKALALVPEVRASAGFGDRTSIARRGFARRSWRPA